jgi:hypothetical protein
MQRPDVERDAYQSESRVREQSLVGLMRAHLPNWGWRADHLPGDTRIGVIASPPHSPRCGATVLVQDFDAAPLEVAEHLADEFRRLLAEQSELERAKAARLTVWAVVYGNYRPAEVDSLWQTEALARRRADDLGGDWHVTEEAVGWEAP